MKDVGLLVGLLLLLLVLSRLLTWRDTVLKKVTGSRADEHYGHRIPEFSAMSNRPGIGYDFFYGILR